MVVVAAYQIYLSQTDDLTQWKGGGYGMYTTIHPTYNKITFNDSLVHINFKGDGSEEAFKESYYDFLLYPNRNTLRTLISITTFADIDSLNVKIHELEFDINNHTATYGEVCFEYTYRKDK